MSDVRAVDPSKVPSEGEILGRALAEKAGEQYENREGQAHRQPPPARASSGNGHGGMVTSANTISIQVPGVGTVELGSPGFATAFKVAKILGAEMGINQLAVVTTRALLYVRKINDRVVGRDIHPPQDLTTAQVLMNELGDAGMDAITVAYAENWGGVKREDLPLSGV